MYKQTKCNAKRLPSTYEWVGHMCMHTGTDSCGPAMYARVASATQHRAMNTGVRLGLPV